MDSAKALKAHYTRGTYDEILRSAPRVTIGDRRRQLDQFMSNPCPTRKDLEELEVAKSTRALVERTFSEFPKLKSHSKFLCAVLRTCLMINLNRQCDIKFGTTELDRYVDALLEMWTGVAIEYVTDSGAPGYVASKAIGISPRRGPNIHRQAGHLTV
jgi:hypothetical protein